MPGRDRRDAEELARHRDGPLRRQETRPLRRCADDDAEGEDHAVGGASRAAEEISQRARAAVRSQMA
jgi:hypothetical protein